MATRKNCWDFKMCGREAGGLKEAGLGKCPASTDTSGDGLNMGKNGGRICWAIAGTFCGGKVQGTLAEKQLSCMTCDFFKLVKEEEGAINFQLMKPGQVYKKHE